MKKEDELKLRGDALEKRIDYHERRDLQFARPFLGGFAVLFIAVIMIFVDGDHDVFWAIVMTMGFVVAMGSLYLGSRHQKRAEALEALAQDSPYFQKS